MAKNVQLVENGIISRSNKLIEARYKLSLHEQKVMYSIISLIQPDDKEFHTFRFKVSELAKFCGISAKNANRDLKEVTRMLLSRVLTIKENDTETQTHWVQRAKYHKNGIIEFKLDDYLKPYLLELKEIFTSMKVSELMSFKSQYSGRIYELLYQYRKFGSRRFTVEEFKELLGIDSKEYGLFGHIKARIIEAAVKDINKNTPMEVCYETEKTGLKITSIVFYMKSEPKQDEITAQEEIQAGQSEQATAADPGLEFVIQQFKDYKIPEADTREYISKYGTDYCLAQLELLKVRLKLVDAGEAKKVTSPKKWLAGCMQDNYAKYISPATTTAVHDCPKCNGKGIITTSTYHPGTQKQKVLEYKCDCWK